MFVANSGKHREGLAALPEDVRLVKLVSGEAAIFLGDVHNSVQVLMINGLVFDLFIEAT
jgi:hypothetical protein